MRFTPAFYVPNFIAPVQTSDLSIIVSGPISGGTREVAQTTSTTSMGNSYGVPWFRAVGEAEASAIFDRLDRDRNGFVTLKELMSGSGPGIMMPHSLPALYFIDKDAKGRLTRSEFISLLRFCDEEKRKVEAELAHDRGFRDVIRRASAAGVKDGSARGRVSFRAISSYSNVRSIFRKNPVAPPVDVKRHCTERGAGGGGSVAASDDETTQCDEEVPCSSSMGMSSSGRSSLERPPPAPKKSKSKTKSRHTPNGVNGVTPVPGSDLPQPLEPVESETEDSDVELCDSGLGGVRMYSSQREFEVMKDEEKEDIMAPLDAESRTAVDAAVLERIMCENIKKLGERLQDGTSREEFMEWLWKLTDFEREGVVTLEELRIFLQALEEDGIFLEELAFYKEGGVPLEESIINEFDTTHTGLLTRDEFLVLGDLVTREYEHWTNRHLERIGDYELGRTIGRGSSGIVRLALHVPSREKVAIKIIKKGNCSALSRLDREIESLAAASHENIVELLEVLDSEENVFIVMELCGGGSLVDIVMLYNDERIPESHARFYCRQLFEAVAFLHGKGICHRDIRLDNLLLSNTGVLKITDFGHSGSYQPGWDLFSTTLVGSVYNLSPEQVDGKAYSGEKIDVWSAGIVLYCLLVGHPPFFDADTNTFLNSILSGTFEIPDFVSTQAQELIRCMIRVNPSDRLPFEQLKLHPWFYSGQESRPVMDTVVIPVDPFFKKRPDLAEMIMAGTMYENNLHFHLADTTNPRSFPEVLRGQAWALKCQSLDLNIRFTVSLFTTKPTNPAQRSIRHVYSYPRFMNNLEPDETSMNSTNVSPILTSQLGDESTATTKLDDVQLNDEFSRNDSDFGIGLEPDELNTETEIDFDDDTDELATSTRSGPVPPTFDDDDTDLLYGGGSLSEGEMEKSKKEDASNEHSSASNTGKSSGPKRRSRSGQRSKSLDFPDGWQLRLSRSVTVDAFPYHMVKPQRSMPEQARDMSFDAPDESLGVPRSRTIDGRMSRSRTVENLPELTRRIARYPSKSMLQPHTTAPPPSIPVVKPAVPEFMPYIEVRLRDGESGLFLRVCRKLKTICGSKLANAAERQKRRVSSRRSVTMLRRSAAAQRNETSSPPSNCDESEVDPSQSGNVGSG